MPQRMEEGEAPVLTGLRGGDGQRGKRQVHYTKPQTGAKAGGSTKQGRVTGRVDGGEGVTAEHT